MKQQRLVLALLLSLVISGVCTYVLGHSMKRGAPSSTPDLSYAAPSRTLQAGEILKPDSVEMIVWPGNKPLHSAFTKAGAVTGRAVLYPLEAGQPILEEDLSVLGAGAGLAAKIPPGMRAIALRSDEVAGVAGFLTPGSHVDVLVTYRTSQSTDPLTATVLQNAEVIAIGQRAQPDPEGKPEPLIAVVTLLLTPEESERAVLASTQGVVHFVLRNGSDVERPKSAPMLLSMLSGAAAPGTAATLPTHAPAHAAAPRNTEIETVLGNEGESAKGSGSVHP